MPGTPTAVVIGAGVGGLSAAAALSATGWRVTVLERQPALPGAGAGISLWPNALHAADRLGIGERLRGGAANAGHGGIRRPSGRWLARTDITGQIARRYGQPLILVHRAELVAALAGLLPAGCLHLGIRAQSVHQGDTGPATVLTERGECGADLVVAADGLHSPLRASLFPGHPGIRYAGYTSWRLVTGQPGIAAEPAETWGRRGERFAILPLRGGRWYCYATANAPAGERAPDEQAELIRRFGRWHDPIPAILSSAAARPVLRTDINELARPLPAMHLGCVAVLGDAAHAMTPDLGQGGCQAMEDAVVLAAVLGPAGRPPRSALPAYTEARLARTAGMVRRSRRAGRLFQAPPLITGAAARVMNLLPAGVIARGFAPVLGWRPPE